MLSILDAVWREREVIFACVSRKKLAAYDYTQTGLRAADVTADKGYQRVYKGFYAMGRRSAAWYAAYFNLLEREKGNDGLGFETVLRALYEATGGRVEPSFSSKLVATIRPHAPVYDEVVRGHLGIVKPRPYRSSEERLREAVAAYEQIEHFYRAALVTDISRTLGAEFDRRLPGFEHFTPTKRLDILLWQYRTGTT